MVSASGLTPVVTELCMFTAIIGVIVLLTAMSVLVINIIAVVGVNIAFVIAMLKAGTVVLKLMEILLSVLYIKVWYTATRKCGPNMHCEYNIMHNLPPWLFLIYINSEN